MPLNPESESVNRRTFLAVGGGLVAATAAGLTPLAAAHAAQTGAPPATGNPPETGQTPPPPPAPTPRGELLPPLRLEPITQPTEVEDENAPTAAPPDRRLGVAIVGLGRLSLEQILPGFGDAKRCKPVALVSGDRSKALQVAAQYGIKPSSVYDYASYDRIADNPEIDFVYIVLPNALHAEYTVRAAQAGKHVLCEKPMATSAKECEQMIAACEKAGRKLMIAYRIQYEPHNRSVRKMLLDGELGRIVMIDSVNGQNQGGDLRQWRLNKSLAGGGSLPDVGLYCLNTLRYITGEEPIEVDARLFSAPGDPRFATVEETVSWVMRFPSGILATCTSSYGFHETRRYRVQGSDAWAEMSPAFSYGSLRLHIGRKSLSDAKAEANEERILTTHSQFALEMDHMAQCIVENKTPWTPGEEGLQDQRIMERIYESARDGKALPLPAVDKPDAFRGTMPESGV